MCLTFLSLILCFNILFYIILLGGGGSTQTSITCNFEDTALCGYKQLKNDNFDWSRTTGTTSTAGTGPTNDHTYGTSAGEWNMNIFLQCFKDSGL